MPVHENPAIEHHQQDTSYYCGGACAQMVLAQIGAGLLDQDDLYDDNHAHSTIEPSWYSGPDGLTWTMNDRRPAGFNNSFVLFSLDSEDLISRKICWTIHHYQVAPIALVYGWAHWIVVRGYEASAAPSWAGDTGYTITAFDINNPWPPTPGTAAEPPHSTGDGCGTGGTRGVANEHVTYATWQSDYMTGVPSGHWSGKFLAVCDPEPPGEQPAERRPRKRREGSSLLTPATARRRAMAGLERHGLSKRDEWARSLRKAEAGTPVLVQRLDRRDDFYYVVPATRDGSVLASVDARFGEYKQAVHLPEGSPFRLDRKDVLEYLLSQRIDLEGARGRLRVRPEATCISPSLVWKPCLESLSPFWPFHLVTLGSQRVYVRVDGAVFTRLHDDVRGI